jgi:hypothetical protein
VGCPLLNIFGKQVAILSIVVHLKLLSLKAFACVALTAKHLDVLANRIEVSRLLDIFVLLNNAHANYV